LRSGRSLRSGRTVYTVLSIEAGSALRANCSGQALRTCRSDGALRTGGSHCTCCPWCPRQTQRSLRPGNPLDSLCSGSSRRPSLRHYYPRERARCSSPRCHGRGCNIRGRAVSRGSTASGDWLYARSIGERVPVVTADVPSSEAGPSGEAVRIVCETETSSR
jgi:hypothetical protein